MRVFDKQGKYTINREETQYGLFLPLQDIVRDEAVSAAKWALEFTSQTRGPVSDCSRSTPAISAPRMAAHSRARRSSSAVGEQASPRPPPPMLARKSVSDRRRMAAATRPPTTYSRLSSPAANCWSRNGLGPMVSARRQSWPRSRARYTCPPREPKHSLTTRGKPSVSAPRRRNASPCASMFT